MRIGVKYCGNCNPQIDMPELVKSLILKTSEYDFVEWDSSEGYDVLLILSSCTRECASRPPFDGPCIAANSEEVEHWPAQRNELVVAILTALSQNCLVKNGHTG